MTSVTCRFSAGAAVVAAFVTCIASSRSLVHSSRHAIVRYQSATEPSSCQSAGGRPTTGGKRFAASRSSVMPSPGAVGTAKKPSVVHHRRVDDDRVLPRLGLGDDLLHQEVGQTASRWSEAMVLTQLQGLCGATETKCISARAAIFRASAIPPLWMMSGCSTPIVRRCEQLVEVPAGVVPLADGDRHRRLAGDPGQRRRCSGQARLLEEE